MVLLSEVITKRGKMRKNVKKAVALRYNTKEDNAPKLIAKGEEEVAQKIIEIAQKHNIPLYEDPELVSILYKLDFYEEIPEEVYEAVALILAEVYKLAKS